jgi:hypothetical protein
MALYKNANYLKQHTSSDFDALHAPGQTVPHSGIYRCEGCGKEVTSNGGQPLPPQNHHQHAQSIGAVRWRMIVYTQTDG